MAKAETAIKKLTELTRHEATFLELDLTSLISIRKAAEEFLGSTSSQAAYD
ncbi:hypothetical protein AcW2_007653 [Taiwanofungus camphoratus]|nr:hypothetical protein AcW2_007653 [Antrodia cinnamomea]